MQNNNKSEQLSQQFQNLKYSGNLIIHILVLEPMCIKKYVCENRVWIIEFLFDNCQIILRENCIHYLI